MDLFDKTYTKTNEYGEVIGISHPIVTVVGLPHVKADEMVVFDNNELGQVQSIREDVTTILLFSIDPAKVGQKVTRLDEVLQVKVRQNLLGNVVDAMGTVIGVIDSTNTNASKGEYVDELVVDTQPPSMDRRLTVRNQFVTGVSLADVLIPSGSGQTELVVGDKKTGKTSFLLSVLKQHVNRGGIVVYVLVGANISEIKIIQDFLQKNALSERAVLVFSSTNSPHGHILISPYTGMAFAEYFKKQGFDVMLILDNLSTHAMYYREVSILSNKFPGRDSYPGDIFYLHARLLERAGIIGTDPTEKGSVTCFPVAQTVQGDLTDYIVSNLISITDGHLYFDQAEFVKGRRPAINIALSVTRLGRQTQSVLLQDINRTISSFLTTKYEKSLQLSHFGSEVSDILKKDLELGNTMYEIFNQDTGIVYSLEPMVAFLAMVWAEIFKKDSLEKIIWYRNNFVDIYEHDQKVKTEIDELVKADTFDGLIGKVTEHATRLQELCKTKIQ